MKTIEVTRRIPDHCRVVDSVLDIPAAFDGMKGSSAPNKILINDNELYIYLEGMDPEDGICIDNFREYFGDSKIYCVTTTLTVDEGKEELFDLLMNESDFNAMFKEKKEEKVSLCRELFDYIIKHGYVPSCMACLFNQGLTVGQEQKVKYYCVIYKGVMYAYRLSDTLFPENIVEMVFNSPGHSNLKVAMAESVVTFPEFKIIKERR